MITQKLAEQLKEAGYKQPDLGLLATNIPGQGFEGKMDKDSYSPTLSELIESCGDRFSSVMRLSNDSWVADSNILGVEINECPNCQSNKEKYYINPQTEGESDEEAVAKLWLKLNKK